MDAQISGLDGDIIRHRQKKFQRFLCQYMLVDRHSAEVTKMLHEDALAILDACHDAFYKAGDLERANAFVIQRTALRRMLLDSEMERERVVEMLAALWRDGFDVSDHYGAIRD